MPILSLIIFLIIVGLILYLIETLLPIDAAIKNVIRVVVIVCLLLYLLQVFLGGGAWNMRIG